MTSLALPHTGLDDNDPRLSSLANPGQQRRLLTRGGSSIQPPSIHCICHDPSLRRRVTVRARERERANIRWGVVGVTLAGSLAPSQQRIARVRHDPRYTHSPRPVLGRSPARLFDPSEGRSFATCRSPSPLPVLLCSVLGLACLYRTRLLSAVSSPGDAAARELSPCLRRRPSALREKERGERLRGEEQHLLGQLVSKETVRTDGGKKTTTYTHYHCFTSVRTTLWYSFLAPPLG